MLRLWRLASAWTLLLGLIACGSAASDTPPSALTGQSSSSVSASPTALPSPALSPTATVPGVAPTNVAAVSPTIARTLPATTTATGITPSPSAPVTPVTSHPRLWIRPTDVQRLRSWAVESNPLYKDGLLALVEQAKSDMDSGQVPQKDSGAVTYVDYPTEMYAELFAFMALISPDQASRDDYARRARSLLMYVITEAAKGVAAGQPFRDPDFAINDRSRWHGEAFALTVDWIYPALSAADKVTIRTVFLRWIGENLNAAVNGHDHPEPQGMLNDPALIKDMTQVRWSLNNYWTAHMRNIGQMALALDPADDPGNTLHNYLGNATGAWLYVLDSALRTEAKGGLLPEGFEYAPQTAAFTAQFLLALQTSGQNDPARYGPMVTLSANRFWDDFVAGYLHSLSPVPVNTPDLGPEYQPAWYGDGQHYGAPDPIQVTGALGLYYSNVGDQARLADMRWLEAMTAPGGKDAISKRMSGTTFYQEAILTFLLFDPAAPPPPDPRPKLPLSFFAEGLGRILARTSWGPDATWFTYKLSWNSVDHQNGDGNQFEFYRHGEWLTKERSGYDLEYGSSDNHNTLALQNNPPANNEPDTYRNINWRLGAQWAYVSNTNPLLVAHSDSTAYTYALGDATALYNAPDEGATDIRQASRSILWLKPDDIVVYDRAESGTAQRFKRFWLNLPTQGVVSGNQTTVTTGAGQKLFVTTLLPTNATITAEADSVPPLAGDVAAQEPMHFRLRVEAPGGPKSTRFLHVLQGADAGTNPDLVVFVRSDAGTPFEGAVIKDRLVLFPVDFTTTFSGLTYTVPAAVTVHYITGLKPKGLYTVTQTTSGSTRTVTVSEGGALPADDGGVLTYTQ